MGIVLVPFVAGSGGTLASAQTLNSPEQLEQVKQAVIKRYLEDEAAFHDKAINRFMWDRRRLYLVNRYIDAARRLDFLLSVRAATSRGGG